MTISRALVEAGARYSLPPYEGMTENVLNLLRPQGEGQPFTPAFMQKHALKL